jgi:hypothetical protein
VARPIATVLDVVKLDLVGVSDIAERLRVPRGTVAIWKHRELMPEPEWTISGGPVWRWSKIEKWARETNRLPEEE